MRFSLDRTLTVPLAVQLAGQIEYAVICGDLRPGDRLPTVRELADDLGVAPVTVSGVYRALRERGLVVSRVGAGTFVADGLGDRGEHAARDEAIDRGIDQLLRVAAVHQVALPELLQRTQLRHARAERDVLRLLLVGIFDHATRDYALAIGDALGPHDQVDTALIGDLRAGDAPARAHGYDAVLTVPHLTAEVTAMVAGAAPVASVSFVPSTETRARLARLQPGDRVLALATFHPFVGTLKTSILHYAPLVRVTRAEQAAEAQLDRVLGSYDAVVYATGSEDVVHRLPRGVTAFEFRHVPDTRHLLATVRAAVAGWGGGRGGA